jgi:hypothetical protein
MVAAKLMYRILENTILIGDSRSLGILTICSHLFYIFSCYNYSGITLIAISSSSSPLSELEDIFEGRNY